MSSKSMLESLLARVRERARAPGLSAATAEAVTDLPEPTPEALAAPPLPPPSAVPSVRGLGVARAVPIADDEIEEYDDELIEILDEEAESIPPPPPELIPLELSPSRPHVEMRRREQPLSERPEPEATPAAAAAGSRELSVERVERAPLPDAVVVATSGNRAEAKLLPFVELLDVSLRLGR